MSTHTKTPRIRAWTTGRYEYVDLWEQLGIHTDPAGVGSENTTGLYYIAGNQDSVQMIKGPDGKPWAVYLLSSIVTDGSGHPVVSSPGGSFLVDGSRGPFVSRWNGANWVAVPGPIVDGGIGILLTGGAIDPYNTQENGTPLYNAATRSTGSYSSGLSDSGSGHLSPTCRIATDGNLVFATRYRQDLRHYNNGVEALRGYWEVEKYDGSWSDLGGLTHQSTVPVSSPPIDTSRTVDLATMNRGSTKSRSIFGSSLHSLPALAASSADPGHPVMLYLDVWGPWDNTIDEPDGHLYVSRWNGSSWDDLGGTYMEATDVLYTVVDFHKLQGSGIIANLGLDQNANPVVVWSPTSAGSGTSSEGTIIYIQTYKSGAWHNQTVELNSFFSVDDPLGTRIRTISLSPVSLNKENNYRMLIGVVWESSLGTKSGVLEYFTNTLEIRMLFNNRAAALIEQSTSTGTFGSGVAVFEGQPNDHSVWIMGLGASSINQIIKYDAVCHDVWEAQNFTNDFSTFFFPIGIGDVFADYEDGYLYVQNLQLKQTPYTDTGGHSGNYFRPIMVVDRTKIKMKSCPP